MSCLDNIKWFGTWWDASIGNIRIECSHICKMKYSGWIWGKKWLIGILFFHLPSVYTSGYVSRIHKACIPNRPKITQFLLYSTPYWNFSYNLVLTDCNHYKNRFVVCGGKNCLFFLKSCIIGIPGHWHI